MVRTGDDNSSDLRRRILKSMPSIGHNINQREILFGEQTSVRDTLQTVTVKEQHIEFHEERLDARDKICPGYYETRTVPR